MQPAALAQALCDLLVCTYQMPAACDDWQLGLRRLLRTPPGGWLVRLDALDPERVPVATLEHVAELMRSARRKADGDGYALLRGWAEAALAWGTAAAQGGVADHRRGLAQLRPSTQQRERELLRTLLAAYPVCARVKNVFRC